MAKRETPRSLLQNYIDSVPTTAPVKRTRARSRSPSSKRTNETLPSQSKKRRRSSFAVKQTPRSMIVNYTKGNQTETPFVRASRRRSGEVTPVIQNLHTDEITPRTAIQALLKEVPDETPLHRPVRNTTEIDSDSDQPELPNDTIQVLTSPVHDENSEQIAVSRGDKKQNRNQITVQGFSKGVLNRTAQGKGDTLHGSDDDMSSSDIQPLPNDTIHIHLSPGQYGDSSPAPLSQREQTRTHQHITLQQFEEGVRNRTVFGKTDHLENSLTPSQSKSISFRRNSHILKGTDFTPSRSISQALVENDLTPSKRRTSQLMADNDLTPSHRKKFQFLPENDSTPSRRRTSQLLAENDLTPSSRTSQPLQENDLTPSKRKTQSLADNDLTPSRRSSKVLVDNDLNSSKRTAQSSIVNHLTPSKRNSHALADTSLENRTLSSRVHSDLTPSKRNPVLEDKSSYSPSGNNVYTTPNRGNKSAKRISTQPDLTPSMRNRIRLSQQVTKNMSRSNISKVVHESGEDSPPDATKSMSELNKNNSSSLTKSQAADLTPLKRSSLQVDSMIKESDQPQEEQDSNFGFNVSDNHGDNLHKLGKRTPLTSNQTILETIQPLSSSTPTKVVRNKRSASETPAMIKLKSPLLTSTPRRFPLSSGLTATPNRVKLKSPRSTSTPRRVQVTPAVTAPPGRMPTANSAIKRTPGRVPVNVTNSSKVTESIHRSRMQSMVPVDVTTNSKVTESIQRSRSESRVKDSSLRSQNRSNRKQNMSSQSVTQLQSPAPGTDGSEEEYEEDTVELYKLKTPQLKEDISRIPTPIYSSTPAPQKSLTKQRNLALSRQPLKKKSDNFVNKTTKTIKNVNTTSSKTKASKSVSTVLPNRIIKQTFQHFCKMKVAPDTMEELVDFTDKYFENTIKSLEVFALHAGRKTVNETDVELMMKRQGLISDKTPLNVLVESYLPLELREEIIPMARANNVITTLDK